MLGIIIAAMENQTNVEIFLTNYLAPDILHTIGERFIKGTDTSIPYVTIHLLAQGSHSGAVAIYDGEKDGSEWVSYIARDLRTSYPDNLLKLNPKIASKIKQTKDYRFQPYVKKPSTMLRLVRAAPDDPAIATIPFASEIPAPMPVVPRASPPANMVSAKLINSPRPPTFEELTSYQVNFPCSLSMRLIGLHALLSLIPHGVSQGLMSFCNTSSLKTSSPLKTLKMRKPISSTIMVSNLAPSLPCSWVSNDRRNSWPQFLSTS